MPTYGTRIHAHFGKLGARDPPYGNSVLGLDIKNIKFLSLDLHFYSATLGPRGPSVRPHRREVGAK